MRVVLLLLCCFFLSCQKNEKEPDSLVDYKMVLFDEVFEKAGFIGIVEIKIIPEGEYWESDPPIIDVQPLVVLKGDPKKVFSIIWQTKPRP